MEVLDSRGNPTVEARVFTKKCSASAISPSGASTGLYEAVELRDNTKRYHGKSVSQAVQNINKLLNSKLRGVEVKNQRQLDHTMIILDGTDNKSRLGANAILSVSLACARCAAKEANRELYQYLGRARQLPVPFANILNGGRHADSELNIQEFMIAPLKAKSFSQAARMTSEIYHELKILLHRKYGKQSTLVGDEGGFAPPISSTRDAIQIMLKAVENQGYQDKVKLAIDAAASEFFDRKSQKYRVEAKKALDRFELVDYYMNLIKTYPIISLEDPFDQDDFYPFQELTKKARIQIVGDDLLVTNPSRIMLAAREKLCNSLLLKLNQVGTLTEALEAHRLAAENSWKTIVSHRSGETEDTFIADLAVALGTGQIKLGAPARGERTCKYNRLLRIEEQLGKNARY